MGRTALLGKGQLAMVEGLEDMNSDADMAYEVYQEAYETHSKAYRVYRKALKVYREAGRVYRKVYDAHDKASWYPKQWSPAISTANRIAARQAAIELAEKTRQEARDAADRACFDAYDAAYKACQESFDAIRNQFNKGEKE